MSLKPFCNLTDVTFSDYFEHAFYVSYCVLIMVMVIQGDEIRWKFTSDGSVNGWGWYFTVYPIMPAAAPMDMLSDRTVLSRPSIDLVTCLLGFKLEVNMDRNIIARLAASLAACAQLSSLGKFVNPLDRLNIDYLRRS